MVSPAPMATSVLKGANGPSGAELGHAGDQVRPSSALRARAPPANT